MESKTIYIVDENGQKWPFDGACALMDPEIMEAINFDAGGYADSEQAFYEEYCRRHLEKYGEEFKIN